uniref:Peptide-O-fucosyltransferase 1 n=1 Tax=Haptolina ericina TaxID=156174 RepID=A0A7S3AIP1_9EUKA|mmetsp:Transcript_20637/g.46125  ORF Transcript_20637/g.46125 Transcript_20637/m.46125 type:complete len:403 (+) Transcript_20637:162-1370(+)
MKMLDFFRHVQSAKRQGSPSVERVRAAWCPHDVPDRFIVWRSTSGTGNAVNSFISAALLAAATCRTLVHPFDKWFEPVDHAGLAIRGRCNISQDILNIADGIKTKQLEAKDRYRVPCYTLATQHSSKPSHMSQVFLKETSPLPSHLWPGCKVVVMVGNQLFAPYLLSHSNLSTVYQQVASALTVGPPAPFFGPASRFLLRPRTHYTERADRFVRDLRGPSGRTALIGVHIRSRLQNGNLYEMMKQTGNTTVAAFLTLYSRYFQACVQHVLTVTQRAGFQNARVYIAADNTDVRFGAQQALGDAYVRPPHYLHTASLPTPADETSLAPRRTEQQNTAAFEELLILARADAIVVKDMRSSTFSSVAANWNAHRAGGNGLEQQSLGAFTTASHCKRLPTVEATYG